MIDFIGIGAQKSGTSWVYSCLYEHPEICAPIKEIHFFSRPRYEKGVFWYTAHFSSCTAGKKRGEFSTSYLYSENAAARIHADFPKVKILAIVRNPIERAFSQYRNAIKAGEIGKNVSFSDFCEQEESVLQQGKYYEQLHRYTALFSKEQLLVLVYEDSKKEPELFMQKVFAHIGVDTTFVPSMLYRVVNTARTPRLIFVDRATHRVAEYLRYVGFHRLVHVVKVLGVTDLVRKINTEHSTEEILQTEVRKRLSVYYKDDVEQLSRYLQRDMCAFWNI